MGTIDWFEDCPKCKAKRTVMVEDRYGDRREECCECGYYHEVISPHSYEVCESTILTSAEEDAEEASSVAKVIRGVPFIVNDRKLLDGFKLVRNCCYVRRGVLIKSQEQRGSFLIVDKWFSVPSVIPVRVKWDEDPTSYEIPRQGNGWASDLKTYSFSELH